MSLGGRIRLVAPASAVDRHGLCRAAAALEATGYVVEVDPRATRRWRWFAGEDAVRAAALVEALTAPQVGAVWCVRGGEGCTRLLPLLEPHADALRDARTPLVGLSDVTALHAWFAAHGAVSWHAPVGVQWARTAARWRRHVTEALANPPRWRLSFDGRCRILRAGRVAGRLAGGNLTVLAALAGTPWCPPLDGAIVLLEDVGEPAYRVDRALRQLVQAARLDRAAALLVGSFDGLDARQRRQLRTLWRDLAASLDAVFVLGVPAGHGRRNAAWPMGAHVAVDTSARCLYALS